MRARSGIPSALLRSTESMPPGIRRRRQLSCISAGVGESVEIAPGYHQRRMTVVSLLLAISVFHVPANLGYGILFALILIESAGAPVPGETSLIAAGVLASKGSLSLPVVFAVA